MKKLILFLSFILTTGFAYSQYGYSGFNPSRLTFGGNLNLQFGDYTAIGISPQIGYNFSKYFTAGAGLGYNYFREKEYDYKWSRHYASVNVFGRIYPLDFLVLSIQPEGSRMWQTVEYGRGSKDKKEKFIPTVLVGGGFRFMGMIAMIQYDVVQDDYSPYGNNIFYSVGYSFNF
ncbi:MAG: hypothetical protein ACK5M0_03800 [Bacteroidales bacterium]|jgi:hypothetical protein|nr:hypothetical protein [Prevotella sp.]